MNVCKCQTKLIYESGNVSSQYMSKSILPIAMKDAMLDMDDIEQGAARLGLSSLWTKCLTMFLDVK